MEKVSILLLRPLRKDPSPEDQTLGAFLAAAKGPLRDRITLQQDSFSGGDASNLKTVLSRWAGKVSGVVGATSVLESRPLGDLAEELDLLCFVPNNNPVVWQQRPHVFHIGVQTAMTCAVVVDRIVGDIGAKRIFILHDSAEFQVFAAITTERLLREAGVQAQLSMGSQPEWVREVEEWNPDLFYLVYQKEPMAVQLAQRFRQLFPNTTMLVPGSLLRQSFLSKLGNEAERLLLVDVFRRGHPERPQEISLFNALSDVGTHLPTANHGFGWDAVTVCGLALAEVQGDSRSAVQHLESGTTFQGATGYYSFGTTDHNGRRVFNPIGLSFVRNGEVKMLEPK